MIGGARAQYHLRQTCVFLNMYPVNRPEVIVTFAPQKFSADGKLTDATARKLIAELLVNLVDWAKRISTVHPKMVDTASGSVAGQSS